MSRPSRERHALAAQREHGMATPSSVLAEPGSQIGAGGGETRAGRVGRVASAYQAAYSILAGQGIGV